MFSPPSLVPIACQLCWSIVFLMNFTEPSSISTFTPPGWYELAPMIVSIPAAVARLAVGGLDVVVAAAAAAVLVHPDLALVVPRRGWSWPGTAGPACSRRRRSPGGASSRRWGGCRSGARRRSVIVILPLTYSENMAVVRQAVGDRAEGAGLLQAAVMSLVVGRPGRTPAVVVAVGALVVVVAAAGHLGVVGELVRCPTGRGSWRSSSAAASC